LAHAKGEINAWIAKDKGFEADWLSGNLNNLVGMEQWTATAADCLDIKDIGNVATVEAEDAELEMQARTPILTPIRLTGRNRSTFF
jgi:hypothetical protein